VPETYRNHPGAFNGLRGTVTRTWPRTSVRQVEDRCEASLAKCLAVSLWQRLSAQDCHILRRSRTITSIRAISKPSGTAGKLLTIFSPAGISTNSLRPSTKKWWWSETLVSK
jgi:hypothetical protein